jgi:hypothetical protein
LFSVLWYTVPNPLSESDYLAPDPVELLAV